MTQQQRESLNRLVRDSIKSRVAGELALGFLRYEALRQLSPQEYAALHQRQLGPNEFDEAVDELVAASVPWPPVVWVPTMAKWLR